MPFTEGRATKALIAPKSARLNECFSGDFPSSGAATREVPVLRSFMKCAGFGRRLAKVRNLISVVS